MACMHLMENFSAATYSLATFALNRTLFSLRINGKTIEMCIIIISFVLKPVLRSFARFFRSLR